MIQVKSCPIESTINPSQYIQSLSVTIFTNNRYPAQRTRSFPTLFVKLSLYIVYKTIISTHKGGARRLFPT